MKRKYFYLMALAALTLGSCSNENDLFGESPNDGPQGEKQQVTFLFPGTAQGVVPYAAPIASEAENTIETLDVYVFGADKLSTDANPPFLLEDVIKLKGGTDGDLVVDGEALKATLSLVGTNAKSLYFVANGRNQAELSDYELNKTTIADFEQKRTTPLGKALLKAPLLMTGRYDFPITDGKLDLTPPADGFVINLNRRVARFDIRNDSQESTLNIERILIKNTRPGAYLFADAKAEASGRPAYDLPLITELMEIDFISYPTANVGETPSVFYVYPSMVDGETSFELKGLSTQSGELMVQPVKMREKQTGTEDEVKLLPINANFRYLINVLNAGSATINATITVKEWQVGQGVDVEAGFGQVKMTLAEPVENVTLTDSKLLNVPNDVTAAFDIAVAADTEWEIVEQDADLKWIAITNRPVIASDSGTPDDPADDILGVVGKKFTIAITEKNPSSEPRDKVLHIRNVQRPSIVQTLTVTQAGSADGFKVTGDRLEDNTLSLFAANSVNTLNLTLPNGVTEFDCESAESWITLGKPDAVTRAKIEGTKLQVTVTSNNTDAERVGQISITVGTATQIIEVKQAPRNLGSIKINAVGMDPATNTITYKPGEQTGLYLIVRALTEWEVTAFDIVDGSVTTTPTDWITNGTIALTSTTDPKANYDGKYNFTITANATTAERKSKVTLINKFDPTIKAEVTIVQQAPPTFTVSLSIEGENKVFATGDIILLGAKEHLSPASPYNGSIKTSNNKPADLSIELSEGNDWIRADNYFTGGWTLSVHANDTGAERSATLTISLKDALAPQVFTIKQAAATPTFSVSGEGLTGTALNLPYSYGTAKEYTVTPSTGDYSALSIEPLVGASWLTLNTATLTTNGKFTLVADVNKDAERTATVTIQMVGGAPAQTITVTQAVTPTVDWVLRTRGESFIDGMDYEPEVGLLAATHTETFYIGILPAEAFPALTLTKAEGADWLTIDKTDLTTKGEFTLTATKNDGVARTAVITINLPNEPFPLIFTVNQAAAPAPVAPVLSISDGTNTNISTYAFAIDAAADAVATFTATATEGVTTGFSVEIETNDWLTLTADDVSTTGQFTITCIGGDNSAGTARTATVTVKVANAEDKTFTITQPGA